MEGVGASAMVLQSLFEAQIELESNELDRFISAAEFVGAESVAQFPGPQSYRV